MKNIISTTDLTKDYGNHKGIFGVNIQTCEGEVYGFLGPNGAGKTTTIRHLMGFITPDQGTCEIFGMDCFKRAADIQARLGYLPGEIAFLDDLQGKQLLQFLAEMKCMRNTNRMQELLERFELDPQGKVKKMSKGMKQKIGIIAAFMGDPKVIILDEPTSGLDPLMQNRFVELILEEKNRGKTILMSSHIFEEIEKTCDRTAIIREGEIVAIENMESLTQKKHKTYEVIFESAATVAQVAANQKLQIQSIHGTAVSFMVKQDMNHFLHEISQYKVKDISVHTQSLEEIFLHYYGKQGEQHV